MLPRARAASISAWAPGLRGPPPRAASARTRADRAPSTASHGCPANVDRDGDGELLEAGDEGVVLREQPGLGVGRVLVLVRVERTVLARPVGHVQRDALERGREVDRVMGLPVVGLRRRVPQTRGSASNARVSSTPLYGGRRLEHVGVTGRVVHGTVAAHREPGDDPLVARLPVALEQLAEFGGVERLPRGWTAVARRYTSRCTSRAAIPRTRGSGHDNQQVRGGRELLDVGLAGPVRVVAAAALQQVEDGPSGLRLGLERRRQQQADLDRADGDGDSMVRSRVRASTSSTATMRAPSSAGRPMVASDGAGEGEGGGDTTRRSTGPRPQR